MSGPQQRPESTAGMSTGHVWGSARATSDCNHDAPGHTVLYKAVDQARIKGLLGEDGTLSDMSKLFQLSWSPTPSNFNNCVPMFSFAPDVKVAEYYAAHEKRRTNCESMVMVVLRIPNAAIESPTEPDIQHLHWPSSDRKQMIWRCTRSVLLSSLAQFRGT
ncbi:hypothetical protein B0T25DRAFT_176464 [Lasiosphaeria hispida]|uniref:Uncharacterized protein n=1 Tax=Lasiosphaeria hispida TaxID=260671 RepID=A0AAJ0MGR5_9PEZI|nr:hypothetical protein B0T25DRAFT_176464 [Lasiosphaeria hispida]